MTEKELVHLTQRQSYLLGAMFSLIHDYAEHFSERDKAIFEWLNVSIENVLYLDKPLTKMP